MYRDLSVRPGDSNNILRSYSLQLEIIESVYISMGDFVQTRVSKLKKDATVNFVSVNYEGPKKKRKGNVVNHTDPKKGKIEQESLRNEDPMDARKQQEREMKRIRYEVIKFGMSGFNKNRALKAKTGLLVSLGAKPPKNKSENYKELKEKRMRQKKAGKGDERVSGLSKSMTRHKKPTLAKKKVKDSILDVYGKVEERKTKTTKH